VNVRKKLYFVLAASIKVLAITPERDEIYFNTACFDPSSRRKHYSTWSCTL